MLLQVYDRHTEQIVSAREDETTEEMRQLEDQYRKITKDLGFNLRIFHKDQVAADYHRERYALYRAKVYGP